MMRYDQPAIMNNGKIELFEARFVELMPREIEEGVLFVSMIYGTAIHNCACGCGWKTVTPFNRDGWILTFNGFDITLAPSIGNFQFPCRSHYFIENSRVRWC